MWFQMQSDWLAYNEYTTCIGIFMWVWLVDSWTRGCSWTCSIPTLVPVLFSPVSHPYISWNLKKNFLMCFKSKTLVLRGVYSIYIKIIRVCIYGPINVLFVHFVFYQWRWLRCSNSPELFNIRLTIRDIEVSTRHQKWTNDVCTMFVIMCIHSFIACSIIIQGWDLQKCRLGPISEHSTHKWTWAATSSTKITVRPLTLVHSVLSFK